jgi:transcriptional regulator with XRE-family HTH domain
MSRKQLDVSEIEERFAQRLRAVRLARNWSAQTVADRSGVTRVAISKIEHGGRGIPLGDAVALSEAIEVPLSDMIRPGEFSVSWTLSYEVDDALDRFAIDAPENGDHP